MSSATILVLRLIHATNARLRSTGDRGAGLVEYTLLVSLIALVALGAVRLLGVANGGSIADSASQIGSAVG